MIERTLLLIKPDATAKGRIGAILKIIENAGFVITELKMLRMDRHMAEQIYAIHKDKSYYEKLIFFMTEGRTVAAILEKENAIHDLRSLLGNTDPAEAEEGTIRHRFGENVTSNAVHSSDSPENADIEIRIIFPERQLERTYLR